MVGDFISWLPRLLVGTWLPCLLVVCRCCRLVAKVSGYLSRLLVFCGGFWLVAHFVGLLPMFLVGCRGVGCRSCWSVAKGFG